MRATFASVAGLVAIAAANPMPQGVTSAIAPSSSAPAGCVSTVAGTFEFQLVETAGKRSVEKRADTAAVLKLSNGILTDAQGRIGSIVANGQFQFDGPPAQAGAEYTAGWSVCPDNKIALGSQTTFYKCLTSNYYNIYDKSIGGQCSPVYMEAINKSNGAAVTQISDGQVQATTGVPVTQISDGQIQATTGVPVTQISDGQLQGPTGVPVTQISDGQLQGPTGKPVTQISDGQLQAPTATGAPVTQISDGQLQGPTGKPVTQISDGQVQAPTGKPVTQISDGQVQAPATTPYKAGNATVPHASTGASTGLTATKTPIPATGAGVANTVGFAGLAAAVFAVVLL